MRCRAALLAVLALIVIAPGAARNACAQAIPACVPEYAAADFLREMNSQRQQFPRATLIELYEQYLAAARRLREESVQSRSKDLLGSAVAYVPRQQMAERVDAARRSYERVSTMEEDFFNQVAARLGPVSQGVVALARDARAQERDGLFVDRIGPLTVLRSGGLLRVAMRLAPDAESRAKVMDATVESRAQLRAAYSRLVEAQLRAVLAVSAAAEASGLEGADISKLWKEAWQADHAPSPSGASEEGAAVNALMAKLESLAAVGRAAVWKEEKEALRAQWRATLDAAAALPPARAARLIELLADANFPGLDLSLSSSMGTYIGNALASRAIGSECTGKLLAAIGAWRTADAAIVRGAADKYVAALLQRDRPPAADDPVIDQERDLALPRAKLWNEFVKELGPCAPAAKEGAEPGDDSSDDGLDDNPNMERLAQGFKIMGEAAPTIADADAERTQEMEFDESASGLPSAHFLAQLLHGLGASERAMGAAEQARSDAVRAWGASVSPAWAEARTPDRHWKDRSGRPVTDAEAAASNTRAFETAFASMAAAQGALADSISLALGAEVPAAAGVALRLGLQQRDPGGWGQFSWRTENEYSGGMRINPFEVLALAGLPAADRTSAMGALAEGATSLAALRRQYRAAAIEFAVANEMLRHAAPSTARTPEETQQEWAALTERVNAAEGALARAVNQARSAGRESVEQMCQKVSPASAALLREEAVQRGFPSYCEPENRAQEAVREALELEQLGDEAKARLRDAAERYATAARAIRDELIAISRRAQSDRPMEREQPRTPQAALDAARAVDLHFAQEQEWTLFLARAQEALSGTAAAKASSLRRLLAAARLDLR